MKKILIFVMMMLLLVALAGCEGVVPESTTEMISATAEAVAGQAAEVAEQAIAEVEEHTAGETHAVHWAYEGEGGPENWDELGYPDCAGATQSPINLASATGADLENIQFAYGDAAVKMLNNGHTIQVDQIEGSQVVIGGETYFLKQFHFHSPSEHTLNGGAFPIEMHLVHKTADESKAAVVGVFIREGAENAALASVWAHLPAEESPYVLNEHGEKVYTPQDTGESISLAALLPAEALFFRYEGSLTTPPCTSGILWSVLQTPIEMSAEQIAQFTRIMEGNNRPLQDLNARTLQVDETP